MAQGSAAVPKFGNWETGDNVPYTVCFEKARKGRSRTKINTIQSQQNSDTETIQSSSFQQEIDLTTPLHKHTDDLTRQRNAADLIRAKQGRRLPESPITVAADSPLHRVSSGDKNTRGMRRNGTFDVSVEQSPLHVSKVGSKGIGVSPVYSLERKGSTGGVPMTPGRSRLRSASRAAAGDDSVDQNAAVPKFGDWDENNPGSADGYTLIFNKVKEERHGGPTKASNLSKQSSQSNSQKHYRNENSKVLFGAKMQLWNHYSSK
ncbi:RPM1-interacting protein 4-like isoform X2 [Euphorbia lathyris]|uniref:RPM1-interacting protein 4-like isoform X2 n=1 Tax=Euphorbia lathyris TaxID=212925 RepID=UPI003314095B